MQSRFKELILDKSIRLYYNRDKINLKNEHRQKS